MIGLLRARGQHQKGHCFTAVALSTLLAICTVTTATAIASTSSQIDVDPITTSKISPLKVNHEQRVELTRNGWEGIELSARLHEAGGLIGKPITWTITRAVVDTKRAGEIVLRQAAPVMDTKLEPGEYLVEAEYGYHKVAQTVTIEPGHRIGMTLILNVGGIRAMSRLDKIGTPAGITAHQTIYALSGPQRGKKIVGGTNQGKILRLGAGTYRIESRLSPGNTIAEHTVTVKPGILSSMELAHRAGLAHIAVVTRPNAPVTWEIRKLDGSWRSGHSALETFMVLAPGRYEAKANIDGATVWQKFSIQAGESRQVRLGIKQ